MKGKTIVRKTALLILYISSFVALFHSVLCNEKPIVAKTNDKWYFPALRDMGSDLGLVDIAQGVQASTFNEASFTIYPPVRYSYDFLNREGVSYAPPLTMGSYGLHLLGTDRLGRDVFAGICRGFYIAFKIGLLSLFFSILIGVFLGLMMGYYGDYGLRWNWLELCIVVLGLSSFIFYLCYPIGKGFSLLFFLILILLSTILIKVGASKLHLKKYSIPIDFIFMKVIELFKSIPSLILLLALLPLFPFRGVFNIIIIFIFIGWRNFARHVRAETYTVKEKEFIISAKSQGQTDWKIMWKQILPNILPTVLILASFSFASLVLLESSLSFLGFGLPIGEVSWGSLLAEGRINSSAWWLSVFPGLCIFSLLLAINVIVDKKIAIHE